MRTGIWTASLLLCCLGGASGLNLRRVEARPGEDVTLQCANFSSSPGLIMWLRVTERESVRCVVSTYDSQEEPRHCGGFPRGRFAMTSNTSAVFLTIKTVNESDSGLYFCGYYIQKNPVIVDATHLHVPASGTLKYLSGGVLGAVTLLLLTGIIRLAVKNRKLQKGQAECHRNLQKQSRRSDILDYAAVTFHPNTEGTRRPPPRRETNVEVIYSSPQRGGGST